MRLVSYSSNAQNEIKFLKFSLAKSLYLIASNETHILELNSLDDGCLVQILPGV